MIKNYIETRISKSLTRSGFPNSTVTVDSHGIAELTASVLDLDDRALAMAIVSTTPGVTGVRNQIKVLQ
ncbi:BON domain-containing protein [Stieleria sedimenti]|uniref:BON domain protein n=1 Tax=Stieleria magnilauensis TaxID=2527963 RepID=A0ABX5XUA7_9BACT|nr:BON domain protein [Planctomycetes bacterium TBK1r]